MNNMIDDVPRRMEDDDDENPVDDMMGESIFSPTASSAAKCNEVPASKFYGTSPPLITPATAAATLSLNTPSLSSPGLNTPGYSLESPDSQSQRLLAALYQSSRRSRGSTESVQKNQLPATAKLPPPPPLYSASDQHQNQPLQLHSSLTSSSKAEPNKVSLNSAAHDSWNTSMGSLMASSLFNSTNSSGLPTDPASIGNSAPNQQRPRVKKNTNANIDWSKLTDYSIEQETLDDSHSSQVRTRSDFEMDINCHEEKESSPPGDINHPPPQKRNRRGSLRMSIGSFEQANPPAGPLNDAPATPSSFTSDAASFDIYVSHSAHPSPRASTIFDDSMNCSLTPLSVQKARSRIQEKPAPSRRTSITIEELEEVTRSGSVVPYHSQIDEKLVRRKIQRLLLIRHCTRCSVGSIPPPPFTSNVVDDSDYFCPVTSHCLEGKALCDHIKTCKLNDCTYKKCLTSREVLGHFMQCKDRGCKVCGPVRSRDKRRKRNNASSDCSIGTIDDSDREWLRGNI